jgi:hypothetical protein
LRVRATGVGPSIWSQICGWRVLKFYVGSICYMQSQTRYMNGQLPSTGNKITPAWDMVFLAGGLVSIWMMLESAGEGISAPIY